MYKVFLIQIQAFFYFCLNALFKASFPSMLIRYPIIIFFLAFCFVSCAHKTRFTEVKVDETTSMEVPEYMRLGQDSSGKVLLKYACKEKDFYLAVISESKEELSSFNMDYTLEGYFAQLTSSPMSAGMANGKISKPVNLQINGLHSLSATITGEIAGKGVFYRYVVIETNKKFYQLIVWTRADNLQELEEDMNYLIHSFKKRA